MCGDFATPNLYAVSQQNCLQALYTRMTVMCRRSGSSSSNDDVERAAHLGATLHQKVQTWLGEADDAAHNTAVLLPSGLSPDYTP